MSRPPVVSLRDAARQQWGAWWAARTPRERRLLNTGAVVIAVALLWVLGLRPALNSIAQSQQQLPRLHAEAAQLDALILEAESLQRRASGQIPTDAITPALQASLQHARLGHAAVLTTRGPDRQTAWEIHVERAPAADLMEWLSGLPQQFPLSIARLELARSRLDGLDQPGQVTGRIVVHGGQERKP